MMNLIIIIIISIVAVLFEIGVGGQAIDSNVVMATAMMTAVAGAFTCIMAQKRVAIKTALICTIVAGTLSGFVVADYQDTISNYHQVGVYNVTLMDGVAEDEDGTVYVHSATGGSTFNTYCQHLFTREHMSLRDAYAMASAKAKAGKLVSLDNGSVKAAVTEDIAVNGKTATVLFVQK